jgi:two-component system KDP operon response regulator KdpE
MAKRNTLVKTKVGVCDADPAMQRLLLRLLKKEGYETVRVASHSVIEKVLEEQRLHMLLLDQPELCHKICYQWPQISVLILSEVDDEHQKVWVLDQGADDYITKPFSSEELLARVRAHLRRASQPESETITSCDGSISLHIAPVKKVIVRGQEIRLTPHEFDLLWQLILNEDMVMKYQMLLQKVWGKEYQEEHEYLRIYIHRLRLKIEADPVHPRHLLTEERIGYKFHSPSS